MKTSFEKRIYHGPE